MQVQISISLIKGRQENRIRPKTLEKLAITYTCRGDTCARQGIPRSPDYEQYIIPY